MKAAIRYFTKSGNTKKLAEAIAQELGIVAKEITSPLEEKADILFLCNSVYWAGVDGNVKKFISENKSKIGVLVNVSTAALIESSYAQVKKLCEEAGVTISGSEFHCKGSFKVMYKGKPDEDDLKAVRKFAERIMRDAK